MGTPKDNKPRLVKNIKRWMGVQILPILRRDSLWMTFKVRFAKKKMAQDNWYLFLWKKCLRYRTFSVASFENIITLMS